MTAGDTTTAPADPQRVAKVETAVAPQTETDDGDALARPQQRDQVAQAPAEAPETQPSDPVSVTEAKPEQQVTVLKSTEDGVEVLGTTAPDTLENIALDSISYSETGNVEQPGRRH